MDQARKVTMRDVAKLAKVSVSSISRYLADPTGIQPLAAYSIKAAIQELNYQPNVLARNLKQNRSNTIGIVVPYTDYTFGTICAVAADYFYERKHVAFVCQTDNDPEKERFYVQSLLSQAVAGLIIAPCGMNTASLRTIARDCRNIVVLDRREDIGCDIVAMDYVECSYRLTRFMLENYLCDGISAFLGVEHSFHTRDCLKGMEKAFADAGADFSRANLVYNCHKVENVLGATRRIYRQSAPDRRPSILALGSAFIEYAVIALNQFGDNALRRVDLAGFAMQKVVDRLKLHIPHVLQDSAEAGITASEVLMRKITRQEQPGEKPRIYDLKVQYHLHKEPPVA